MSVLVAQLKELAAVASRCRIKSAYQSVLDYGRMFAAPESPRPKGMGRMAKKLCFSNSFKLAERIGGTYVEGYATAENIPLAILHAWVITRDGLLIDPTWTTAGVEYFGIPFRQDYLHAAAVQSSCYGILENIRWREFVHHPPERFLAAL